MRRIMPRGPNPASGTVTRNLCKHCGRGIPGTNKKRYCDRDCKRAVSSAITGACETCGAEIRFYATRPRRYCSRKCLDAAYRTLYPESMPRCEMCNKELPRIYGRRPKARFCSRACRVKASNVREVACKGCGIAFRVVANLVRYYCSRACKSEHVRLPPRKCVACSKEWTPTGKNAKQIYCSRTCMAEAFKDRRVVVCATCQAPFDVPTNTRDTARCCSKKCLTAWQRRNIKAYICKWCGKTFCLGSAVARDRARKHGINYCSRACCMADPEHFRNIARSMNKARRTQLEIAGYAMLDAMGVEYRPQFVPAGRIILDAFVPSANLIIEFDGDYWHVNPAKYPDPNPAQRTRIAQDRARDARLTAMGYRVLRIWESDMHKRSDEVRERIRVALAQPGQRAV